MKIIFGKFQLKIICPTMNTDQGAPVLNGHKLMGAYNLFVAH